MFMLGLVLAKSSFSVKVSRAQNDIVAAFVGELTMDMVYGVIVIVDAHASW